jgi:hypothetical protein
VEEAGQELASVNGNEDPETPLQSVLVEAQEDLARAEEASEDLARAEEA